MSATLVTGAISAALYLAVGAVVPPALASDAPAAPAEEAAAEAVRVAGAWADAGRAGPAAAEQRWSVDALRSDGGQVRGRITVGGSPLVSSANLEGVLSGRGVYGRLLDDGGEELATFQGAMTAGGAAGTYRDRAGAAGTWQWQGQPQPPAP